MNKRAAILPVITQNANVKESMSVDVLIKNFCIFCDYGARAADSREPAGESFKSVFGSIRTPETSANAGETTRYVRHRRRCRR